jgi:hypothetical protein
MIALMRTRCNPHSKGWEQNKSKWTVEGEQSSTLTKGNIFFFSVKKLQGDRNLLTSVADVLLKKEEV